MKRAGSRRLRLRGKRQQRVQAAAPVRAAAPAVEKPAVAASAEYEQSSPLRSLAM